MTWPRAGRHDGTSCCTTRSSTPGRRGPTSSHAGDTLRIIDLEGNQAVDCLLYNADDPAERYSAPDTIAAQGNIFLVDGLAAAVERGPRR